MYRRTPGGVGRDTSPVPPAGFWPHQVESTHLTVKIGPLNSQDPGGVRNPASVMLKDGGNVIALKLGPGLPECGVQTGRTDAPFELGVRQHVLEANESARRQKDQTSSRTRNSSALPRHGSAASSVNAGRVSVLTGLPETLHSSLRKCVASTGMSSRR